MKNIKTKFFFAFLFGIGLSGLQAQESVLSGSGNATGEGSVSYSIGQVTFFTKTGTNGTLIEGVQVPFEILIPTGLDDEKGITLECLIYPNPTDRYVKLRIEKHDVSNLSYQLYNLNGLLLQNRMIGSKETLILMDGLEKATYFLKITENSKALKTFQVIKN